MLVGVCVTLLKFNTRTIANSRQVAGNRSENPILSKDYGKEETSKFIYSGFQKLCWSLETASRRGTQLTWLAVG